MPLMDISLEFMNLIESYNIIKKADYDELEQIKFVRKIKDFLESQIRITKLRLFMSSKGKSSKSLMANS